MSLASASLSTFGACQDLTLDRLHDEFILSSKQNVVNALNRLSCFLGSPWLNCYLMSITNFFSKQRICISAFCCISHIPELWHCEKAVLTKT